MHFGYKPLFLYFLACVFIFPVLLIYIFLIFCLLLFFFRYLYMNKIHLRKNNYTLQCKNKCRPFSSVCLTSAVTLLYEILSAHRGRALAAHHPLHDACHLAGRHPHSVLNPADQHLPQSRCTKPAAVLKLLSKQLRSQTPLADACTQLFHQPRCTVADGRVVCRHQRAVFGSAAVWRAA